MPWKERTPVDLRMQLIQRHRDGERMVDLCHEFGISRKTAYKFLERYERFGVMGLADQSRAPRTNRHRLNEEMAELLVKARKAHPSWGGRKLKKFLSTKYPELVVPAASSIGTLLKRRGLVQTRKRRATTPPYPSPLTTARAPNDVWCTDYKGQFRLGNGKYCYPLTITDRFSRFILGCEGFEAIDLELTMMAFEAVFRVYGLPIMIRSDNGSPFASHGLWGLTRLTVWWWRLGIWHERIEPASPQQNGQHERMHRDLKRETTRPAAKNHLAQQERFDLFVEQFDTVRPHEALDMRTPSESYVASPRKMPDRLPDPEYPLHDDVIPVSAAGHVRIGHTKMFISSALSGQLLGLRERDDGTFLLSFLTYDLGTCSQLKGGKFMPFELPQIKTIGVDPATSNSSELSPMFPV